MATVLDPNTPMSMEMVDMVKSKIAVLKGLYVVIRMPTEERLTARFEDLSKENFEKLTELAERYMKMIDEKYRLKNNRGRSWKGAGHLVVASGAQNSRRTVRFSPFPSSTLNSFKTLRKMRSDAYHKHCIVLERQEESFQNNINILPYANAPDFVQELQQMNRRIDEVNVSISEFLQAEEWTALLQALEPYGVAEYLRAKTWTVDHCTLITTEIALETSQVKQHIEEEYRKMFTEVDAEKAKALDAVHEEFEKGQRSIAEQALESLRKETAEIVKRIISASRKPARIKEDLERLRRKVISIGLDALEPTIVQLEEVFDDPEKASALFGGDDLGKAVDGRIQGLIESL